MSTINLQRADPYLLIHHLALYGLAAILEESIPDICLGWTTGMQPLPWISADNLDHATLGDRVRDHAQRHAADSWLRRTITLGGKARGLMSPRLTTMSSRQAWEELQDQRHQVLDDLLDQRTWTDLIYLAALGEPCYWSRNYQGQTLQDHGAHRMEMQPRNQGSEFIGNRLRKLADAVAARPATAVADGVTGEHVIDEIDTTHKRTTPTGLMPPAVTDNALAWCALWGIGQLPSTPRINAPAATSGHLGASRQEWFTTPVWAAPWRPARLRTILASRPLLTAATTDLPSRWSADTTDLNNAHTWLATRGVLGLIRFPIGRFGSDNAPERRALRGTRLPLTTTSP